MERVLASMPNYSVVSQAGLPLEIRNLATADLPDVWILDPADAEDILDIIAQVARLARTSKIVVFSARSNIDYVMRVLEAGATGYLTHGSAAAELLDCVQAVLDGETFVTPSIATKLIASLRTAALRKMTVVKLRLTLREEQIVGLLRQGKTNREMAGELDLSEKTIKHYMTILMHKLAARSRLEVVLALRDFDPASAKPPPPIFH